MEEWEDVVWKAVPFADENEATFKAKGDFSTRIGKRTTSFVGDDDFRVE